MAAASTEAKTELRQHALAVRSEIAGRAGADAAEKAAENFFRIAAAGEVGVLSLYHAMRDELDPAPLLARLCDFGNITALPVIDERDQPLKFRRWSTGDRLVEAAFGTFEPEGSADIVVPETLVVPLAAFDGRGHRLGYGGGYYDRTLAELRKTGKVLAVGYAYAGQELAALPADDFDQRLDWVVTEQGARAFA